jgi:hypothetical protein
LLHYQQKNMIALPGERDKLRPKWPTIASPAMWSHGTGNLAANRQGITRLVWPSKVPTRMSSSVQGYANMVNGLHWLGQAVFMNVRPYQSVVSIQEPSQHTISKQT